MNKSFIDPKKAGLLVIDVQERLFAHVERGCEVIHALQLLVRGCQILNIPVTVTEQNPQGLGVTLASLRALFDDSVPVFAKTTFSAMGDAKIRDYILAQPIEQWILTGMEAHICVLQTAKELLTLGKQVIVINDAITSRSIYDFSTAIAELRDMGVRITSAETFLFEALRDASSPQFKPISQLLRTSS